MAISQEDLISAHRAEKKRKAPAGPSSASTPRYHIVQNSPPAPSQKAPQPGRWIIRPPQQQQQTRFGFPQQARIAPQQQQNGPRPNAQPAARPDNNNRCFRCGSPDHFAKMCPRRDNLKGRLLAEMIRTRARGKPFKSGWANLTSPASLTFQKEHQLCRVHSR